MNLYIQTVYNVHIYPAQISAIFSSVLVFISCAILDVFFFTIKNVTMNDLMAVGSCVSSTSTSFEQRLTTLPAGVESKKDMGACSTRVTMTECITLAADRVPNDIVTVPRNTASADQHTENNKKPKHVRENKHY